MDAIELLRKLEWVEVYDGMAYLACPSCGGAKDNPHRQLGHLKGCELARLISAQPKRDAMAESIAAQIETGGYGIESR